MENNRHNIHNIRKGQTFHNSNVTKTNDLFVNKNQSKSSTKIGDYVYCYPSIGKGSSSRVYYGYHSSTGNVVAVKKISKNSIQKISMERITHEIELMKKLLIIVMVGIFINLSNYIKDIRIIFQKMKLKYI